MGWITRRGVVAGLCGAALVAACGNGINSSGGAAIDARVDATLSYLFANYPDTQKLRDTSAGMLVMPLVTEAGLLTVGGSYGRGALRIGGSTVDFYSATQASLGLQLGAQQYAHVLFFMTQEALSEFRSSPGWAAGADLVYVARDQAGAITADTTTQLAPVVAVVFGQAGLMVGATLQGTKYNRIIP